MNKTEFIKRFNNLTEPEKHAVIFYYNDILKSAVFLSTFEEYERRLLWIREAQQNVI